MTEILRESLTEDQICLLRAIHGPFSQSGEWPLWQYVDLTLDAKFGLDAAVLLESLPSAGQRNPLSMSYGLTWRSDSHMQPLPGTEIALTVAGLSHLGEAAPLLAMFLAVIELMIEKQRRLVPEPRTVVDANVAYQAIYRRVLKAGRLAGALPEANLTLRKDQLELVLHQVRQLLVGQQHLVT